MRLYDLREYPVAITTIGVAGLCLWLLVEPLGGEAALATTLFACVLVASILTAAIPWLGTARTMRLASYLLMLLLVGEGVLVDHPDTHAAALVWVIALAALFTQLGDVVVLTAIATLNAIAMPVVHHFDASGQLVFESVLLVSAGLMIATSRTGELHATSVQERLHAQLIEAERLAQLGSFEWNAATDVAIWSPEMYAIFGVDEHHEQPLGLQAFAEQIVDDDRAAAAAAMESVMQTRTTETFEATIRRADGEERVLHVIARPFSTASGLTVIGSVQDVTDLRHLDSLREEFVASASHELRTPTTIIAGFASTLRSEWDQLPPDDRFAFVEEIDDAAQRLALLIEDVLHTTRIEAGWVRCERKPFDLRMEVEQLVSTWRRSGQVDIAIDVAPNDASAGWAVGDALRTRQVLANLLENAARYATGPGTGEVTVRLHSTDTQMLVSVIDHGPGIDRADQARIFDRFVRLSSNTIGTGLGLYIGRQLAEAQGGALEIESASGCGSTFTLRLPRADPHP